MPNPNCPDCKGTGTILLLTSSLPCVCTQQSSRIAPKEFPRHSTIQNAWYSKEQDEDHGYCLYRSTTTGEAIKVTEVGTQITPMSQWEDLRYLGVVDKFIKGHKRKLGY